MHLFLPALTEWPLKAWVGVGHMVKLEEFYCLSYVMSLAKNTQLVMEKAGHLSCLLLQELKMETSVLFERAGWFYWELPPPVTCSAGVTADPNASHGVGHLQSCPMGVNSPEHCDGTGGKIVVAKEFISGVVPLVLSGFTPETQSFCSLTGVGVNYLSCKKSLKLTSFRKIAKLN